MSLCPSSPSAPTLYRAALLSFADDGRAQLESDALLVVGPGPQGWSVVQAVGPYAQLAPQYPGLPVQHWPGRVIAPGFVDMHLHMPQTDVIGAPAEGLLSWLDRHVFPQEARFADPAHAREVAGVFLDELRRHGVTTALVFGSSHPASVDALLEQAQARGQRLIAGKSLQDRHCPDGVRDQAAQSLRDTEALIQRWHGRERLGYAITPRFAPACSDAQLHGAAELAAAHPSVWIQSHVAESLDEIRWARALYPQACSYLAVYDGFGLLRERAVYAHCLHWDDTDRALLRDRGAVAAVCPTSNLFLGSGFFDFARADALGVRYGLASDVGAGTSFSPFHTMLAAYQAGRASTTGGGVDKQGVSLSAERLWWLHTAGAAHALGLGGVVGNLVPGADADFVVLNPQATPLLARRTAQAASLEEWLFAWIVLGDDRGVERVVLAGER